MTITLQAFVILPLSFEPGIKVLYYSSWLTSVPFSSIE